MPSRLLGRNDQTFATLSAVRYGLVRRIGFLLLPPMPRFRLMVKRGPCKRPQASEGEAQDVSVKETSVCIVDEMGKIVRE
jgi:hypothetical protein